VGTFLLLDRLRIFPLLLLLSANVTAQDRKVDPTWLRRSVPEVKEVQTDLSSPTCHYSPIFGTGDPDSKILRSVSRFAEVSVDAGGSCQSTARDREEEIDVVVKGTGTLRSGDEEHALRANDFTYVAPGVKHSISNNSSQPLRVLVMSFKIPKRTGLTSPPQHPRVINLDDVKEETVSGHPDSVLYKLMVGPRGATRDAIDDAYVVTSLFWMDFAPGGTNFPHHHETAEEIYLLIDGQGEMVAGSGMDGIEGRYPAKPGDAYYFRPNCTVGFYNQNKAGAKAYILAVRSRIPVSGEDD
jgi:mannose-6-phosphate isomerase-like protein (cupin superfamily)